MSGYKTAAGHEEPTFALIRISRSHPSSSSLVFRSLQQRFPENRYNMKAFLVILFGCLASQVQAVQPTGGRSRSRQGSARSVSSVATARPDSQTPRQLTEDEFYDFLVNSAPTADCRRQMVRSDACIKGQSS